MRVAVLGAGLAGLAAARVSKKAGIPVTVYEAQPQISGLAQTFDEDGFIFDFGPHFITNRFAAEIGIADECERVRYGESVWLHGHHSSFPFGVGLRPRYAASLLAARLAGGDRASAASVPEMLRRHYGRALSDELLIPMLEKWAGEGADGLAPDVLGRIPAASSWLLAKMALGRMARLSLEYMAGDPRVVHVYPRTGLRAVFRALLEGLEPSIRLGCPVGGFVVEDNRIRGVSVGGEEVPCDAIVYTLPATLLPRFAPGVPEFRDFDRLKYRPLVVANLKFKRESVLPALIVWYPQREIPFFRASEPSLAAGFFAPKGSTLVCVEFGCQVGDEIWKASDEEIVSRGLEWLNRLYGVRPEQKIGSRVLRTPYGYPIHQLETEGSRERLHSGALEGFFPCGRNGAFAFHLMEDVHRGAVSCGETIVSRWARGITHIPKRA